MNPIELDIMRGMISILNEANNKYYNNNPIMTNEQYDIRLADLKHLEQETNFAYTNSPIYKKEFEQCSVSLKNIQNINENNTIEDIVNFSNQKEMVAYIDVVGLNISITYVNGVINNIQTEGVCNLKEIVNMPYKIDKEGTYIVDGKIVFDDKPKLLINNTNSKNKFCENLNEAKELGFDTIPFWYVAVLNSKKIQSAIDWVFDYADDEKLSCNGVAFKFNDTEHFKDSIVYKK